MTVRRVAMIFDNTPRPETTGLYCRRALGSLVEVEHFLPDQVDSIPAGMFDLFLNIDDGLRYPLPDHLRPAATWIIDTHVDFTWSLEKARQFDFVFAAQRDGTEQLRDAGISLASWLPLACDPVFHTRHETPKQFDVCFVGNQFPGPRQDLLQAISQVFPNTFVGRRYFEEMSRTFSASRIVFNRSLANDINMRVFEALASGSLLMTNALNDTGQSEMFQDEKHLVTYRDEAELLERIEYYLCHEDEREQIAAQGRAAVLSRHTYLHRMTELLRTIERSQSPQVHTQVTTQKASACLVSWKRPDNVRRIVQELKSHPVIDDIVIWNNNPGTPLAFHEPNVTVINSDENVVTWGRFAATKHARHDLIYTQDDDCLVGNVSELLETFRRDPTAIAHGLKLGHLIHNAENYYAGGQVALVGWGGFFDRRWCRVFDEYTAVFGENELLHRKADRIFSLLQGRRHRSIPAQVTDLPGASGEESLSVRSDHMALTHEAIGRCVALLKRRPRASADKAPIDEAENMSEASFDASYFGLARPEILERVPESARRVLDVGCGAGRLGEAIKRRQNAVVWGIELNPAAAAHARTVLNHVLEGDAQRLTTELSGEKFDAIVCGDILEHLRDPLSFLRQAKQWLRAGGRLIASIPNVRHHSVVNGLINGHWTYEAAGLLDEDHVRFFTRREIEKLIFRAGMSLESLEMIPGPGYEQWSQSGRPDVVQLGGVTLSGLSEAEALEFHTYQYLISVSSQPPAAAATQDRGLIQLATEYQWPGLKPMVPIPREETGWLADGARNALAEVLGPQTRVVVELGSWLGMSTRFIADHAPAARVIAVDHWQGSPEHHEKTAWSRMLPMLYETFLAMNWDYRNRIIPVRESTLDGLRAIASAGITPDVVFFDADHSQEAVAADLALAAELFPETTFVGDDLDDPGVAAAVAQFETLHGVKHVPAGSTWRAWRLQSPGTRPAAAQTDRGLTSIVIITHNQLGVTQQCLRSIRQFTDLPFELILIDNASTDGTREYLRSLDNVTLVENASNKGFPAAANQGIRAARGNQILLLNNDTVVTTGWLERLVGVLHSAPNIGLVGPCSNAVSGTQQVAVTYEDLSCLDGFAWDWARLHRDQTEDTDRLVGFCLLMRRELIDEIGLLDEQFGLGCFEDDDLCHRARNAGYRAVIAREAFVHHFGSVTFRASGTDFGALMAENQKKFEAKWSGENHVTRTPDSHDAPTRSELPGDEQDYVPGITPPAPEFDIAVSDEGALLLTDPKITLSLCMIVRDNEDTIRPCLESIRPWVDEIIIVDTGSVDRTPEICQEFGARMFEFPWIDDFSAARNESIRHARGEWVFWMDSDDTIPQECGRGLRELADGDHETDVFGYVIQVHCPGDASSHDLTVVDHVKLFRNHKGLEFEGRIHEQIIPAIRRAEGEVAFTELYVVHSGSDRTEAGQKRKLERDFRILNRELEDQPDHPFVRFNLGMTHADAGNYEEAIEHLRHCIAVSQAEESHLRKAYALLVSSCVQSQRADEALDVCLTGLKLYSDDKELLFRKALVLHELGRLQESAEAYHRVLDEEVDRHFTSVDPAVAGFKARHNLAVVYDELGRPHEAQTHWQLVLKECPDYPPSVKGLVDLLLRQSEMEEVDELSRELKIRSTPLGWYVAARLAEAGKQTDEALQQISQGRQQYPDSLDLLQEECRLLFELQGPPAAHDSLEELTRLDPGDASAWHNLAAVAIHSGDRETAIDALTRSLTLRPESIETTLRLSSLHIESGNHQEAMRVLNEGLQFDPQQPQLRAALRNIPVPTRTG